jgi:hypothetical protein
VPTALSPDAASTAAWLQHATLDPTTSSYLCKRQRESRKRPSTVGEIGFGKPQPRSRPGGEFGRGPGAPWDTRLLAILT